MSTHDTLVLVIEDEPQMRRFIRASMESHGYRILEASTGAEMIALATSQMPDVILLDLGLPDGDGIDLTRRVREWSRIPIIVISARGREEDKVAALDAGADDYLTKPFGVNELLARAARGARHAQGRGGDDADDAVLEFGELRIDLARRKYEGRPRHLFAPIEYKLLGCSRNAGRGILRIGDHMKYGERPTRGQSHHVRVHMAELRKKIEADPARRRLLTTEPGVDSRLRDRDLHNSPD